jgi:hypothetical protein
MNSGLNRGIYSGRIGLINCSSSVSAAESISQIEKDSMDCLKLLLLACVSQ